MSRGQPGEVTLTPRQQQIVQVIETSLRDRGYAPSMREIGDAAGLASSAGPGRPPGQHGQTRRRTATTLPTMTASSPRIGA